MFHHSNHAPLTRQALSTGERAHLYLVALNEHLRQDHEVYMADLAAGRDPDAEEHTHPVLLGVGVAQAMTEVLS